VKEEGIGSREKKLIVEKETKLTTSVCRPLQIKEVNHEQKLEK
jgi:hypothetical protein